MDEQFPVNSSLFLFYKQGRKTLKNKTKQPNRFSRKFLVKLRFFHSS